MKDLFIYPCVVLSIVTAVYEFYDRGWMALGRITHLDYSVSEELSALSPATDKYLLTGHAPFACKKTVPSFSNAL